MIWVGVAGSWRYSLPEAKAQAGEQAWQALEAGKGIVTGGALGVDAWAMEEVMLHQYQEGTGWGQLKVILPSSLAAYVQWYRKRARDHIVTERQAEYLIDLLHEMPPGIIVEHPERGPVTRRTLFQRNQDVVDASDELVAFHVNNSPGTRDTIARARAKGIPVTVYPYSTGG